MRRIKAAVISMAAAASLVGGLCLSASPASAATAAAPVISMVLSDTTGVMGEQVPVYGFVSPVKAGTAIRLQEVVGTTWTYVGSAAPTTNSAGEARINFIGGRVVGPRILRLVAVINGTLVASSSASLYVNSDSVSSPGAPASVNADGDVYDELNTLMCQSIARVFDNAASYGEPEDEFIATLWSTDITEQMCDNKSQSEAIKIALTEALWKYAEANAEDAIAKATWDKVIGNILNKAFAEDFRLDGSREFITNVLNKWILEAIARISHLSAACIAVTPFPGVSKCNAQPVIATLEAHLIR